MALAEVVVGWGLGAVTGVVGGWTQYVRQRNDESRQKYLAVVRDYLAAVLEFTSAARLYVGMDTIPPVQEEVLAAASRAMHRALADALLLVPEQKVVARMGVLDTLVQQRLVPLLREGTSRRQWEDALEAVRPHQVELVQQFRRAA